MLNEGDRIHCVGVGGIGVGALAELLILKGYRVSGSDVQANTMTERLLKLGVEVELQHSTNAVKQADLLVYSSAIPNDNPERCYALEHGIPQLGRGQMMAELFNQYNGIAIAGSHGKTTTTSLVSHLMVASRFDPTYSIGGVMAAADSPVRLGMSDYFIAEADESDQSFLHLRPSIAVVTNIDYDHLGNYDDSYALLLDAFVTFLNAIPDDGVAILNADDEGVQAILSRLRCSVLTYGLENDADYRLTQIQASGMSTQFEFEERGAQVHGTFQLSIPGKHNVSNALAALAVVRQLGVSISDLQTALRSFSGVGRRMQSHGVHAFKAGEVLMLEDYGHHPKAIEVTIDAVRSAWPGRRLVMLFEPHRYTRTQACWSDFVTVLSSVDVLLLAPIYAASEKPIMGVSSECLYHDISQHHEVHAYCFADKDRIILNLPSIIRSGDIILIQGAGSLRNDIEKIKAAL